MDEFFYMLLLAALAIPVIAIAALVVALTQLSAIRRLDQRLHALELARTQGPLPQAAVAPTPAPPPPASTTQTEAAPTPITEAAEIPGSAVQDSPAVPPPLPPSPPATVPPVSAARPSPPRLIGFEERFGTRWVVWVGGIALALGGIFLVRYTIQQGLIGPRVRIALGALL